MIIKPNPFSIPALHPSLTEAQKLLLPSDKYRPLCYLVIKSIFGDEVIRHMPFKRPGYLTLEEAKSGFGKFGAATVEALEGSLASPDFLAAYCRKDTRAARRFDRGMAIVRNYHLWEGYDECDMEEAINSAIPDIGHLDTHTTPFQKRMIVEILAHGKLVYLTYDDDDDTGLAERTFPRYDNLTQAAEVFPIITLTTEDSWDFASKKLMALKGVLDEFQKKYPTDLIIAYNINKPLVDCVGKSIEILCGSANTIPANFYHGFFMYFYEFLSTQLQGYKNHREHDSFDRSIRDPHSKTVSSYTRLKKILRRSLDQPEIPETHRTPLADFLKSCGAIRNRSSKVG